MSGKAVTQLLLFRFEVCHTATTFIGTKGPQTAKIMEDCLRLWSSGKRGTDAPNAYIHPSWRPAQISAGAFGVPAPFCEKIAAQKKRGTMSTTRARTAHGPRSPHERTECCGVRRLASCVSMHRALILGSSTLAQKHNRSTKIWSGGNSLEHQHKVWRGPQMVVLKVQPPQQAL